MKEDFENIKKLIKDKINFLNLKEKEIDLSKPEKYNKAILSRIQKERDFINELLAALFRLEDLLKKLSTSNNQLRAQNTIYFHMVEKYESEFEKEYGRTLRTSQAEQ